MAKKNNNKRVKKSSQPKEKVVAKKVVAKKVVAKKVVAKKEEDAITWDDIAAMSDSDDEGGVDNAALELNTKAKTLKQSITKNISSMLAELKKSVGAGDDEEEFEEAVLDGSSSEEEEGDDDKVEDDEKAEPAAESADDDKEEGDDDKAEEENEPSFIDQIKNKPAVDEDGDNSDSESDNSDEGINKEDKKKIEKYTKLENNNSMNSKALIVVAAELNALHSKMPWGETFAIVAPTPLPFGQNGDPDQNPLDIHDDLKREVAFYNTALEAVNLARPKLKAAGIPFTRPDDFFAEMVKTDGKYDACDARKQKLDSLGINE
jgi:rRNA-processing protein EBP2